MSHTTIETPKIPASAASYARYLLIMAGLGGLLYGVDVGIIAAALPYIEQTSKYTQPELSLVVAAVLGGSVVSSLFAGLLADIFGRKAIIILSAILFSLSIPIICFSNNVFGILMAGRILQGASGGLIGVVVPLYLAECLSADSRGKGTGMFQFLLTVGLVFAALIGLFTGFWIEGKEDAQISAQDLTAAKETAWQLIFWVSIIPGIILTLGAFKLSESPRWLYSQGRKEEALKSLERNNGPELAKVALAEMEQIEEEEKAAAAALKEQQNSGEVIFQAKYIIPFVLAVVILACNQATGINSVLNYSVKIFQQAGLEGLMSNYGDTALKIVNCIMTVVAVALVDKKGRKFLLKLGTSGIIVGLVGAASLFLLVEKSRTDITEKLATQINTQQGSLTIALPDVNTWNALGIEQIDTTNGNEAFDNTQVIITYAHGDKDAMQIVQDFKAKEKNGKKTISEISIASEKDIEKDTILPLHILKAEIGQKPTTTLGWGVAICFIVFISFYAAGPGVCVWLALSELMPTRIRSNGMAIALLINQGVSTVIAGSFLPWVGAWGYSGVFYTLAGCTVIYFITAAFFLPETKGKTLEEIEEYFASKGKKS